MRGKTIIVLSLIGVGLFSLFYSINGWIEAENEALNYSIYYKSYRSNFYYNTTISGGHEYFIKCKAETNANPPVSTSVDVDIFLNGTLFTNLECKETEEGGSEGGLTGAICWAQVSFLVNGNSTLEIIGNVTSDELVLFVFKDIPSALKVPVATWAPGSIIGATMLLVGLLGAGFVPSSKGKPKTGGRPSSTGISAHIMRSIEKLREKSLAFDTLIKKFLESKISWSTVEQAFTGTG